MSKKTFVVVLSSGASHTIQAESFHADGRDVTFDTQGLSVAHFCGVESVIVDHQRPVESLHMALVPGEAASFDIQPRIVIEGGNITINGGAAFHHQHGDTSP